MNQDIAIAADINEAAKVISTNNMGWLIWKFDDCPLSEIKYFVPNGKEELVIVCNKDNLHLTQRLVYTNGDEWEPEDYIITLNFHPIYRIVIVRDPTLGSNTED